jgi:hypothetical protein
MIEPLPSFALMLRLISFMMPANWNGGNSKAIHQLGKQQLKRQHEATNERQGLFQSYFFGGTRSEVQQ